MNSLIEIERKFPNILTVGVQLPEFYLIDPFRDQAVVHVRV